MVGDSNVGKTSLVRRLILDQFSEAIDTTIGIEFMIFKTKINDTKLQLQIWDTAGQEKYRALGRAYYRDAVGVMLVFSYTDRRSFESLSQWIKDTSVLCNPHAKITLVGNKSDLINERHVTKAEVEEFAAVHKIDYIETSAKLNTNVAEAFYRTTRAILQGVAANEIKLTSYPDETDIDDEKSGNQKCC